MKMGTTPSPSRYDAVADRARQSAILRPPASLGYASWSAHFTGARQLRISCSRTPTNRLRETDLTTLPQRLTPALLTRLTLMRLSFFQDDLNRTTESYVDLGSRIAWRSDRHSSSPRGGRRSRRTARSGEPLFRTVGGEHR